MKSKIQWHPLAVMAAALIAGYAVMHQLAPSLVQVYGAFDAQLPWATQVFCDLVR